MAELEDAHLDRGLSAKRVLVTGAAGFIGQPVVARLAETSATVFAMARSPVTDASTRVEWIQGDVGNTESIEDLFRSRRPDTVIHLAGVTNAARRLDRVAPSFAANAQGTVTL